jgi:hypothetical protein
LPLKEFPLGCPLLDTILAVLTGTLRRLLRPNPSRLLLYIDGWFLLRLEFLGYGDQPTRAPEKEGASPSSNLRRCGTVTGGVEVEPFHGRLQFVNLLGVRRGSPGGCWFPSVTSISVVDCSLEEHQCLWYIATLPRGSDPEKYPHISLGHVVCFWRGLDVKSSRACQPVSQTSSWCTHSPYDHPQTGIWAGKQLELGGGAHGSLRQATPSSGPNLDTLGLSRKKLYSRTRPGSSKQRLHSGYKGPVMATLAVWGGSSDGGKPKKPTCACPWLNHPTILSRTELPPKVRYCYRHN